MPNIAIVNTKAHAHLRVKPEVSADLGDGQRFVPVGIDEFSQLATYCPIFLAKDAGTGAFYCGAMLGFDMGENLFLSETNADRYRPLNLKRQPFCTAGDDLAIDLNHPRVSDTEGEALFSADGKPSAFLDKATAYLRRFREGEAATQAFIRTLLDYDLVEPIDIDIAFDDGASLQIDGLYVIKKTGLGELDDQRALAFFRRGYLYLVHAMMVSLGQFPGLIDRRNRIRQSAGGSFPL